MTLETSSVLVLKNQEQIIITLETSDTLEKKKRKIIKFIYF